MNPISSSRAAALSTLTLALLAACGGRDAATSGDSAAAPAVATASAPAATSAAPATPAAPLAAGETEIVGIAMRLPAAHTLRVTTQGADFLIYAVAPSAQAAAPPLVEFYLGDQPRFDANGTRTLDVNGLVARDRIRQAGTPGSERTSREVLLELPRSGPVGAQPSRMHVWYNGLDGAAAARADSLIASVRCCLATRDSVSARAGRTGAR